MIVHVEGTPVCPENKRCRSHHIASSEAIIAPIPLDGKLLHMDGRKRIRV